MRQKLLPYWLTLPLSALGLVWVVFGITADAEFWAMTLVVSAIGAIIIRRSRVLFVLHRSKEGGIVIWYRSRRQAQDNPNFRPEIRFPGDADAPHAPRPTIDSF
jgi:hypothetical protein